MTTPLLVLLQFLVCSFCTDSSNVTFSFRFVARAVCLFRTSAPNTANQQEEMERERPTVTLFFTPAFAVGLTNSTCMRSLDLRSFTSSNKPISAFFFFFFFFFFSV
eukprot:gnl/Hemi2/17368_TR5769_c0_g2_i1.p2 gnl/Hemi2/17368_TR5769_c0_g2~~gnl/Hemi2/17368_TR5769_c0_g2_i1.p2  ORF type:complete len:106 (+),score=12.08 gnl/Hemi2/17368_TR5769_c0_g2_i1:224-541(+)